MQKRIAAFYDAQGAFYCPTCGGSGHLLEEYEEEIEPRTGPVKYRRPILCPTCKGVKVPPEQVMAGRRKAAGIPEAMALRMRLTTFMFASDDPIVSVYRHVQAWANQPSVGIFLTGHTGVGKTHLAVAAATVLAEAGVGVQFWEVRLLLEWLRQGVKDGDYQDRLDQARDCSALVLDDYGAERATDFGEDVVEGILFYRYDRELPFLVTTNMARRDLSPRLASRLSDGARVKVLECVGRDRRL